MPIQQAALEALNKRGRDFIVRIKQDLKVAGKSASGSLISKTTGSTKIVGSSVVFEAKAPEHWKFVDEGRRKGIMPPVKPLEKWVKKKGLKLNAFAVAMSIKQNGIQATHIYSNAIEDLKKNIGLDNIGEAIAKEIRTIKTKK